MGYSLLIKELPGFETHDFQPILRSLLSRQVDGILWAVPEIGHNRDWLRERLPEFPVPLLFLTMSPQPSVSVVSIDNYVGGYLAVQHLHEQGYVHIGHLAGPLDWWEARQRKAGWQDGLLAAGLPVADHFWVEGNWSSSSAERAFSTLLGQYPEMDAVFVANDQMALTVLQLAHRKGLRVPGDLGVVGFDGIPEAAYFWPSLTTIDQDQHRLGGAAVQQLVKIIQMHRQGHAELLLESIFIKPQLVIRESSTPNLVVDGINVIT
jgi:LacI family transcriptional regulator